MSVFFDGKLLTTPQTASAVNDDAMLNQNLSVGNVIAYVGQAQGGESGKVMSFGTPNEAKQVLIGGELCDAVVNAFAPSTETGAPQTVKAIRVNKAQQASLDLPLASGSSGTGAFGTLLGKTFSNSDLSIKAKVEQGSDSTLVSITVAGGTGANAWSFTGEDVNAAGVKVNINAVNTSVRFTRILNGTEWNPYCEVTTDIGTPDEKKTTVDLTQYPTLGDINDFISTLTNKAGVKVVSLTFLDADNANLLPTVLDVAIYKTDDATTSAILDVHWTGYAIQDWFDKTLPDYVSFKLNEANHDHFVMGPAVMDYKFMTMNPATAPTNQDWSDAFDLLERDRNVQWVHAVTGNASIHAMVTHHVTVCSNQYKERRAINGTVSGTTDAQAIAAAKSTNSPRVSLVHIGHYAYDNNGKLVLRPPYMTAGLVAACFAGVNPGTPLTNKSLAVQGLERDLRNPTDTDALLMGGVMPIENTETGYKVTQSISTWLGNSKYNLREQSCGVAIDFTQRNVRQAVDQVRGSKQSPILLSRALSIVKGQLTELAKPEPMGPAVLVGDENSPAFRNITGTVEGDVLRIQYEASPVIPNNYILVTMYARPYSGTATA